MITAAFAHFIVSLYLFPKQLVQPFLSASENVEISRLFIAGFGNTMMDIQAYHSVGMNLSRIFKINKRSEIVTFDKLPVTDVMMESLKLTRSNKRIFSFRPRKWYKDRMGTVFLGYSDPRLLSQLTVQTEHLTESPNEDFAMDWGGEQF